MTIATECYTCYFWLPATIQKIRHAHPEFEVSINTNSILNPLDLLQNGKIDIAIIHRKAVDKNIRYTPLFANELILVLPQTHPLALKPSIVPSDLNNEIFITHTKIFKLTVVFEKLIQPHHIKVKKWIYMPLTDASVDMVRAGLGISILPEWLATSYIKNGDILCRKITTANMIRKWYAADLKSSNHSDAINTFIETMQSQMKSAQPNL